MKTVRQASCGPEENFSPSRVVLPDFSPDFIKRTKIFDVNCALVAKTGRGDRKVFAVRDEGAITAFSDPQTVNRSIRFECNLFVEVRRRATGWHGNFLWELLDRAAYFIISTDIAEKSKGAHLLAAQTKLTLLRPLFTVQHTLVLLDDICWEPWEFGASNMIR
jgi:hypothetical protein